MRILMRREKSNKYLIIILSINDAGLAGLVVKVVSFIIHHVSVNAEVLMSHRVRYTRLQCELRRIASFPTDGRDWLHQPIKNWTS